MYSPFSEIFACIASPVGGPTCRKTQISLSALEKNPRPCFDLKEFPTFTAHLRMKPDSCEISRRGLVGCCAFEQTKLNFILVREGRPLPYGYVALSIVGEAFCLPLVSNLINTIAERTMYAKTLPSVKFFE